MSYSPRPEPHMNIASLAILADPMRDVSDFWILFHGSIDHTNLAGQDMNIIILENVLSVKLISDTSCLQVNPENTVIICECNWSVSVCGRIYSRTHRNCFGVVPSGLWGSIILKGFASTKIDVRIFFRVVRDRYFRGSVVSEFDAPSRALLCSLVRRRRIGAAGAVPRRC